MRFLDRPIKMADRGKPWYDPMKEVAKCLRRSVRISRGDPPQELRTLHELRTAIEALSHTFIPDEGQGNLLDAMHALAVQRPTARDTEALAGSLATIDSRLSHMHAKLDAGEPITLRDVGTLHANLTAYLDALNQPQHPPGSNARHLRPARTASVPPTPAQSHAAIRARQQALADLPPGYASAEAGAAAGNQNYLQSIRMEVAAAGRQLAAGPAPADERIPDYQDSARNAEWTLMRATAPEGEIATVISQFNEDTFAANINPLNENDPRHADVNRYFDKLQSAGQRKFFSGSLRHGFIATPDKQLDQVKELLARLPAEDRPLREYILTRLVQVVPQRAQFFPFQSKNKLLRIYQRYLDPGSLRNHSTPAVVDAARQDGAPTQQVVSDSALFPILYALMTLTVRWDPTHRQGVCNIINAQLERLGNENPWAQCALLYELKNRLPNIPTTYRDMYAVPIRETCRRLYAEETQLRSEPDGTVNAERLEDMRQRTRFLSRYVAPREQTL